LPSHYLTLLSERPFVGVARRPRLGFGPVVWHNGRKEKAGGGRGLLADYWDEPRRQGGTMATGPTTSAPPRPLSLVNLFFWQAAGLTIGGLTPPAALASLPSSWVVIMPDGQLSTSILVAVFLAPLTAALGGIVGTVVGFYDRRPTSLWV
jgi:hypothetical protein